VARVNRITVEQDVADTPLVRGLVNAYLELGVEILRAMRRCRDCDPVGEMCLECSRVYRRLRAISDGMESIIRLH